MLRLAAGAVRLVLLRHLVSLRGERRRDAELRGDRGRGLVAPPELGHAVFFWGVSGGREAEFDRAAVFREEVPQRGYGRDAGGDPAVLFGRLVAVRRLVALGLRLVLFVSELEVHLMFIGEVEGVFIFEEQAALDQFVEIVRVLGAEFQVVHGSPVEALFRGFERIRGGFQADGNGALPDPHRQSESHVGPGPLLRAVLRLVRLRLDRGVRRGVVPFAEALHELDVRVFHFGSLARRQQPVFSPRVLEQLGDALDRHPSEVDGGFLLALGEAAPTMPPESLILVASCLVGSSVIINLFRHSNANYEVDLSAA